MAKAIQLIAGGSGDDLLTGDASHELFSGRAGNDVINTNSGDDKAWGGSGDDTLYGKKGADVLYGGGAPDMLSLSQFTIAHNYSAKVIFEGESAGYKNSLGSYKVNAQGEIYDVTMHFSNASLSGSGGSLIAGISESALEVNENDRLGFFIIANGFNVNSQYAGLNFETGTLEFKDQQQNIATVSSVSPALWFTGDDGQETQLNLHIYHSIAENNQSNLVLNSDNISHVKALIEDDSREIILGFEDLYNGGDLDFDDCVFRIDIGNQNTAALLNNTPSEPANPILSDDDLLYGNTGADILFGQRGDDQLWGGNGADQLTGGSGDDLMYGGSGTDSLFGGTGDDQLWGDSGTDTLRAGSGNDQLHGGSGADNLYGDSGNDILYGDSGYDNLFGGSGDDILYGGNGRDVINGGSGNDIIDSGRGRDQINGGAGSDTVSYESNTSAVRIDLHAKRSTGGDSDTYQSIENAIGSANNDWFRGDKRDNTLNGGAGDDELRGAKGADTLIGGEGEDSFVWRQKDIDNSLDIIQDFNQEEDLISLQLDNIFSQQNADDWLDTSVQGNDTYLYLDLNMAGVFDDAFVRLHGIQITDSDDLGIWS